MIQVPQPNIERSAVNFQLGIWRENICVHLCSSVAIGVVLFTLSFPRTRISANFTVADQKCHCHPERSEGSRRMNKILRYAQDDNVILTVFLIELALMGLRRGDTVYGCPLTHKFASPDIQNR